MEHFVKYEQAKALAEFGFDEYCTHYYWNEQPDLIHEVAPKSFGLYSIDYDFNYTEGTGDIDFDGYVSAPSLYQAKDWLYKHEDIYIEIRNPKRNVFKFGLISENFGVHLFNKEFTLPENALSAGLDEAIKYMNNEEFSNI